MRLWRLTRAPYVALDGAGPAQYGGRYSSPGRPLVNFASEAALAVLVALRYLPRDLACIDDDYVLGWTDIDAVPHRIPSDGADGAITDRVDEWLGSQGSLLAAVRSKVLPEADIIMMNPLHPDAAFVSPLVVRPFSFAECLHTPPMLDRYGMQE